MKRLFSLRGAVLDREHRLPDRALFDLAMDGKLRGCDLVKVRIGDLVSGGRVRNRAMVIQQKTKRPVELGPAFVAKPDRRKTDSLGWEGKVEFQTTVPPNGAIGISLPPGCAPSGPSTECLGFAPFLINAKFVRTAGGGRDND